MASAADIVDRPVRIALFMPTSSNYWRGVVRGVARYCQNRPRWTLHLRDPQGSGTDGTAMAAMDAIIAAVETADAAQTLLAFGKPVINVSYLDDRRMTKVGNHDEAIGAMGASHLLRGGFGHLTFVGYEDLKLSRRREAGFRQTVEQAGRTFVRCPIACERWDAVGEAEAGLRRFLEALPQPAAAMTSDDMLAMRITEMAGAMGRRVPDDLAVLGINNDDMICALSRPQLSSVELAVERIGMEAAARLEAILRGDEPPGRVVELPPLNVVVRRSTDVLAISDEMVGQAVRFIRANAHRALCIEDVLKVVPVSRSSLQRRFREALGHGPQHEIRMAHVEIAKRLLAETDSPLKAVAMTSGLVRPQQLSQVFRQVVGMTPGRFRRHARQVPAASADRLADPPR